MNLSVLFVVCWITHVCISAPVVNNASAQPKEVDVIFRPSYGNNVQYDFLGAGEEPENVTDGLPKPAVQVIFEPSFSGTVEFSHLGSGAEEGESETEPDDDASGDASGMDVVQKPAVEAVFYPSFKGRVYYHHFRADGGHLRADDEREKSQQKEVDVVFYPSYGKNVQYSHMGHGPDPEDFGSGLSEPAVQVIFRPSFEGVVEYTHYGSGDETEMEIHESGDDENDDKQKPAVQAEFYPSFGGNVYYHHFRNLRAGDDDTDNIATAQKASESVQNAHPAKVDTVEKKVGKTKSVKSVGLTQKQRSRKRQDISDSYDDVETLDEEVSDEEILDDEPSDRTSSPTTLLTEPSQSTPVTTPSTTSESPSSVSSPLTTSSATVQSTQPRSSTLSTISSTPSTASSTPSTASSTTTTTTTAPSSKCVSAKVCFGEADCNGGHCLGLAAGKCNCGPCVSLMPCADDRGCGGLRGACDTSKKRCDCEKGFRENGFPTIFDAWRMLCNQKDCLETSDSCFGLPCNNGICVC